MAIAAPDWLAQRDGALARGHDGLSTLVLLSAAPQYRLTPVPAAGRYGCSVVQTNNGRRLDNAETFPSADAAVLGGLDVLRQALGW